MVDMSSAGDQDAGLLHPQALCSPHNESVPAPNVGSISTIHDAPLPSPHDEDTSNHLAPPLQQNRTSELDHNHRQEQEQDQSATASEQAGPVEPAPNGYSPVTQQDRTPQPETALNGWPSEPQKLARDRTSLFWTMLLDGLLVAISSAFFGQLSSNASHVNSS
jgi:hypothetical protein